MLRIKPFNIKKNQDYGKTAKNIMVLPIIGWGTFMIKQTQIKLLTNIFNLVLYIIKCRIIGIMLIRKPYYTKKTKDMHL